MSSNRYTHNRKEGNNRFTNNTTQKKFVPKTPNPTTTTTTPDSSNPTLSSSLRQHQSSSSSRQSNPATTSTSDGGGVGGSGSRVRIGDKGDWVSTRAQGGGGGNFVNYLPQDEAVAAGLNSDDGGLDPSESQRVVDLLNRELSRLLKLSPRDFWKEVASDSSFHDFLDSFLQFRSRWYDFPHHSAKGIVAGVIVNEFELSRRVFMVLYRISSNRDPGARVSDSVSLKDHGVLLQEKKLLDLPKLLDICAIYAHENEDLTRVLVVNAIKAQPWIHDNLTGAMSHFLSIGHTLHQRCITSLEVLFSSGGSGDHNFSRLRADFLEVMDFINDAIVSMDAFVSAYGPAALFFSCPVDMSYGNEELLITLARLHDSLLPSLQRGFRIICTAGEDKLQKSDKGTHSEIAISLKMLSMRIVRFGWKLLDLCYLSDEVFEGSLPRPDSTKMFPATVEDPAIRADILIQTFREIGGVSDFQDSHNRGTFLQNAEKTFEIIRRFEGLQSSGWISMDVEQLQYLYGILMHPSKAIVKQLPDAPISAMTSEVQTDDDAAILESKISQIKDIFPDYGKGFLSACLEAYNQNPEEVIQRILEGSLHEDLQSLDTSMEKVPPRKSASSVSRNDKGKGILLPSTLPPTKLVSAVVKQPPGGPSNVSSSSVGRYVRKSKIDEPNSESLDSRDGKDLARTSALISQYEYEDEYDDSFDDLGLSVEDSGLEENEILGDRMNSNLGRSSRLETESSVPNPSNMKWNSGKKPQFFVKDGKNYSYKVQGSVAVANSGEASLVNLAQKELIHGLGRGGNLPLGAVKKLTESYKEQDEQSDVTEMGSRGNMGNPRGRGRRGGNLPLGAVKKLTESHMEQDEQSDVTEMGGRGNMGNPRGRGRRGGGGRNNYRKDQAMKKHFAGLSGF